MRSRSLIKKVGVVLLATMLLASIGLTGFATGIVDGGADGFDPTDRVSATVEVDDVTGAYGFYNVAINYTNNTTLSNVGITMLAYAETADRELTAGDIENGYSDEGTLQIVGINQTEVTQSGTFNFLVDTNPDTVSSGLLRMDRGDVGIVLLSADGAVAPTGYLFAIPAAEQFTVTTAQPLNEDITVKYGTAIEDVLAQLATEPITVSDDNGHSEENWTAENWTVTDYNAKAPGTYTATGQLKKPEGAAADIQEGGKEVTIYVTVDDPEASWIVTEQGSLVDPNGNPFESVTVKVADANDDEEILAAIKAFILDAEKVGGITVYGTSVEDGIDRGARVLIDEDIAETLIKADGSTYELTIPTDAEVQAVPGEAVTIADAIYFTFNVTVEEDGTIEPGPDEPTGFDAVAIKAVDAQGAEVTSIEVDNGTSEADAKAALAAKVAKAIVSGAGEGETEEWTITDWTIAGYNATTASDYTATATLEAPADAQANLGDLTLTVTVTVKAAQGGGDEPGGETYLVGDVTGDGKINGSDWQQILKYTRGNPSATFVVEAADVTNDGKINGSDWQQVLKYTRGNGNGIVGTTKTK